jgi:hypothetical protein
MADSASVAWMEQEIRSNTEKGGHFQTIMFYSWHYGPRRMKLLMEKMKGDGYEFVTMNEFDHLWRESFKNEKQ